MENRISHEDLMRFLDGELPPEEHARVETEITASTELSRELAIFKSIKGGFQDLSFHPGSYHHSVWDAVNNNLTRRSFLSTSLRSGLSSYQLPKSQ